ncbi:hypothetical protein CIG2463D_1353 [Campylobacter iguaniorum]|uniref:putative barnase/colicin E5 family endoribonuclease n=1 Tax=Campylobacter iguaniorum TaxID=1244531 RepID=UPI00073A4313|nr:hypothetical protein [Campylobacter iguaniorum]ALV24922.1 hypothetical protein CIG2463D_1353 [Campylobacter iguaniorum]
MATAREILGNEKISSLEAQGFSPIDIQTLAKSMITRQREEEAAKYYNAYTKAGKMIDDQVKAKKREDAKNDNWFSKGLVNIATADTSKADDKTSSAFGRFNRDFLKTGLELMNAPIEMYERTIGDGKNEFSDKLVEASKNIGKMNEEWAKKNPNKWNVAGTAGEISGYMLNPLNWINPVGGVARRVGQYALMGASTEGARSLGARNEDEKVIADMAIGAGAGAVGGLAIEGAIKGAKYLLNKNKPTSPDTPNGGSNGGNSELDDALDQLLKSDNVKTSDVDSIQSQYYKSKFSNLDKKSQELVATEIKNNESKSLVVSDADFLEAKAFYQELEKAKDAIDTEAISVKFNYELDNAYNASQIEFKNVSDKLAQLSQANPNLTKEQLRLELAKTANNNSIETFINRSAFGGDVDPLFGGYRSLIGLDQAIRFGRYSPDVVHAKFKEAGFSDEAANVFKTAYEQKNPQIAAEFLHSKVDTAKKNYITMQIEAKAKAKNTPTATESIPNINEKSIDNLPNLAKNEQNTPKTSTNSASEDNLRFFTDNKGNAREIPQEIADEWKQTFNLKSLDGTYTTNHKEEIKNALGGKEIRLKIGSLYKLVSQNREQFIKEIKAVIDEPEFIIKDTKDSYILGRHYKNDDYFVNVSIDKGGYLVSISNGFKWESVIDNKLGKGAKIVYQSPNSKSNTHELLQASQSSANTTNTDIIPQNPSKKQILQSAKSKIANKEELNLEEKKALIEDKKARVKAEKEANEITGRQNDIAPKAKIKLSEAKLDELAKQKAKYEKLFEKANSDYEDAKSITNQAERLSTMDRIYKQRLKPLSDTLDNIDYGYLHGELKAGADPMADLPLKATKSNEPKQKPKQTNNNGEMFLPKEQQESIKTMDEKVARIETARIFKSKFDSGLVTDAQIKVKDAPNLSDEEASKILAKHRANIAKELGITPTPEFGTNYAEFYHDGANAIKKVLAEKQGQVAGAFERKELGDIDLVWDDGHYGLSHILEQRTKQWGEEKAKRFISHLDENIKNGVLVELDKGRYGIKTDLTTIVLDKKDNNDFIITAFRDSSNKKELENLKLIQSENITSKNAGTIAKDSPIPLETNSNTDIIPQQAPKINEPNLVTNKNIDSSELDNAILKEYAKKNTIANNGNSPIMLANEHIGGGLVGGTINGVETDENGNISFDPAKFALGFLAGAGGVAGIKRANKFLDNNPQFKQAFKDELAKTLSNGWEKAKAKNPLLKSLDTNSYIVPNEKGVSPDDVIKASENLAKDDYHGINLKEQKSIKPAVEANDKITDASIKADEFAKPKSNSAYTKAWDSYERLVDRGFDKLEELAKKAVKKGVDLPGGTVSKILNNVLDFEAGGKAVGEIFQNYRELSYKNSSLATKIYKGLSQLNKDDRKALFYALDSGDTSNLSEAMKGYHTKFRTLIDNRAATLVNLGVLDAKNAKENYIKYFYSKFQDEQKQGSSSLGRYYKRNEKLSLEDRKKLGLIDDSAVAISSTLQEQGSQINKALLLRELADKFGSDVEKNGYVLIPDEDVGGGVKKYGALSGKWVPKEIKTAMEDVGAIKEMYGVFTAAANEWFKVIDHIKVNLTVKNPFTHVYNVGSNISLAFLQGDLPHLAKLTDLIVRDRAKFNRLLDLARELGLNTGMEEMQIKGMFDEFAKSAAKEVSKERYGQVKAFLLRMAKNVYGTEDSKLGKGIRTAYGWEDAYFKLARFYRNLERGMDEKSAFRDANKAYVDYSSHFNKYLRLADKAGVVPFLHYAVKSTPLLIKSAIKNPVKFAMLQSAAVYGGASAWLGGESFEEQNALAPKWAGSSRFPNFMGVKNWTALGDSGISLNTGRLIPGMRLNTYEDILGGGGFIRGAIDAFNGRNSFGGSVLKEDDGAIASGLKIVDLISKQFLPTYSVGRYGRQLISAPFGGVKDANGEEVGVGGVLLRGVGVRAMNEKKELNKNVNKAEKTLKDDEKSDNAKAKATKDMSLYQNIARKRGWDINNLVPRKSNGTTLSLPNLKADIKKEIKREFKK